MIYPFCLPYLLRVLAKTPVQTPLARMTHPVHKTVQGIQILRNLRIPMPPSVTEADAWCYTQGGSTNVDYWAFSATVTDPQGVDTVESFMTEGISFELAANGSQVKTIALVCDPSGACTGSVHGYGRSWLHSSHRLSGDIYRPRCRWERLSAIHHSMP